jgi:HEAT repeat protein
MAGASTLPVLSRSLDLRPGEGRTVGVLGGFLLLVTATTTVLAATKNGLFLSVYPAKYIPHVIVAAAVVSAVASILFSAVIAGTARRSLAARLTAALAVVILASDAAFDLNPRWSLGVYLVLSAAQVLMLTHAWDYAGDLLTGRQAKRLAPLLGIGASVGTMAGGASVPFVVSWMGTQNLLLLATVCVAASLPLLWAIPEPAVPVDETSDTGRSALRAFVSGAGRGLKAIRVEPLLTLMGGTMVFIVLTGTLIEMQFKTALQSTMERDQITSFLGVMSSVVGFGTLLVQVAASRWIFPRLGVSFAARMHAALLTLAAAGAAVVGGVWMLAVFQATDDILQNSVQKPVEQVSLLPFPGPVKSASVATLGGVVRPLSEAGAGVLAILLASRGAVVPWVMVATAGVALLIAARHRGLYMDALMKALSRRTVDFAATVELPLVVDREALAVVDRGLDDPEPTVVVFSIALLAQLPPEAAVPRVLARLDHPIPEVRAEAARVLGRLELGGDTHPVDELLAAIARETSGFALASMLDTLGEWGRADAEYLLPLARSGDPRVRRSALVALARSGWKAAGGELARLLAPGSSAMDRIVGAEAVGALGATEHLEALQRAVEDPAVRPAALEALSGLGAPAVPALAALLRRRDLPLPVRRSVVTALAAVPHQNGRDALLALAGEPALGPAALTSLHRLRRERRLDPVEPTRLRYPLQAEVHRGLRCALSSAALRRAATGADTSFLADELAGLAQRSTQRILRMLALSHDPGRIAAIQAALASDDAPQRSNALELLEGTLASEQARIVMPYADAVAEGFAEERVAALVADLDAELSDPLEALADDSDWWTRTLALHGLGRDREITIPGRDPDDTEDPHMIPIIERVMILKGSQLFRNLPGNDLAGIASLSQVVYLQDGETVFRQGDAGDAFFMVVQGSVRILTGSHELAVLGPREAFGEMAILDQETRSATAVASAPTTLLKIDRDSFDRLIEQNPAVARGIYRMLTQRLRNTLAQLAAG